jgi:hypothetical protein
MHSTAVLPANAPALQIMSPRVSLVSVGSAARALDSLRIMVVTAGVRRSFLHAGHPERGAILPDVRGRLHGRDDVQLHLAPLRCAFSLHPLCSLCHIQHPNVHITAPLLSGMNISLCLYV